MGSVGWESVVSNALGSAAAGVLSRLVTHPLDTVKARLQVVDGTSSMYQGPFQALRQIWTAEGWAGWYRGFSTVIVGGTPGTILYLCSYDIFKHHIAAAIGLSDSQESFSLHFSSGLLAEAVACIVYVPVDVIKERLQVQHLHSTASTTVAASATTINNLNHRPYYKNGTDALIKIIQQEGWYGIYRGYGATLASFGPFSALYFVCYERFKTCSKEFAKTDTLSLPYLISSSALAGAVASFVTSPLDLAKLRLQVQRGNNHHRNNNNNNINHTNINKFYHRRKATPVEQQYHGMVDCLQHAYRRGGISGLFRGSGARVLHFVPATTVTMTTYETMRGFFHGLLVQG